MPHSNERFFFFFFADRRTLYRLIDSAVLWMCHVVVGTFLLREYRKFCTPSSDGTWYSTILHYLSTDIRLRIAAIDSSRDLWFFLFVTWNRESVCKFATTSTRSTWEISMRYNANYTAQVVWFVARTRYLSIIVQPKMNIVLVVWYWRQNLVSRYSVLRLLRLPLFLSTRTECNFFSHSTFNSVKYSAAAASPYTCI